MTWEIKYLIVVGKNESYQTNSKLKVWKELKQLSIYHMTICKIESK